MEDETEFDPYDFANEAYALKYHQCFDEYLELRIRGYVREDAVTEAFALIQLRVSTRNAAALGLAADCNPYVKARFQKALQAKDIKRDLWTLHDSVNELLKMVRNPRVRDATRLNAIGQLNVMCQYVQMDEATAKRVGKTLSEFQKQHETWLAAGGPTDGTPPPAQVTH